MRLNFANERVMAVVAHPDDAEVLCAGTLARAKADAAAIGVCVLCRGDKGQSSQPVKNLGEVRREEMSAAAELLGAELFWGGFGDGELVDGPLERKTLNELYRHFRPTLILAHSIDDYHCDHRAAGALAEAVSWFCTSAGHKTGGAPLESQPALWWMDVVGMNGFTPGFFVDVSEYVELKRSMLACHKSQLARGGDGGFMPLEQQMLRQCQTRGDQSGVTAAEAFRTHTAWKRAGAW